MTNVWNLTLENFMGHSPTWYKKTIISFLILNPIILFIFGKNTTGWFILIEFIITLAFSLKCYPLLPGGLIVIESILLKLVDTKNIFKEIEHNIEVIFLLIFMVAGIYFMKEFLSWVFTKLLFITKSKTLLSLMFMFSCAFLSAWLDALTVIAVMITVATSFYEIYNSTSYAERVPMNVNGIDINSFSDDDEKDVKSEELRKILLDRRNIGRDDLKEFESFLRNILMHSAIGTAIGGSATIVGEPQNLLIGNLMGWSFGEFFLKIAPISIPIAFVSFLTVIILEKFKLFGYGYTLPERVKNVLKNNAEKQEKNMTKNGYFKIYVQMLGFLWLIIALSLHLAPVGLIGLSLIILMAIFTGKNEEHQIGKAFEESLPFASLLVVFFGVVALIHSVNLFEPIMHFALSFEGKKQVLSFFTASAILSAISDNVFVATIYIQEAMNAFNKNIIDRAQLEQLAIAINIGTNIPSISTPNGQAAFLFLLTSGIANRIKLSYIEMLKLALPYAVILTITSVILIFSFV